jgi:hypothetical protein
MSIICSKSFIVYAIFLLFKIRKKNMIFFYCTCEPFLFMKDDNCVDKEYEEANEQGVVARRWRCIFY